MTASQTPSSRAERRLAIARRVHRALVDQNPDRVINLCDSGGEVVAHHDPRSEQGAPGIIPSLDGSPSTDYR
jgi:hypothetical protein